MSYQWVEDLIKWMIEYSYEKNTPDNIIKFGVSVADKETKRIIGWCGLGSLDCKPEDIEIFYRRHDGELYYALTKDEYSDYLKQ